MTFTAPTFLFLFLPLFIILYYMLPWKNTVLLIASMLFYTWGEPVYVLLMLAVIAANYLFGLAVNAESKSRRLALIGCVAFNISVLVFFKYSGFIVENINQVLAVFSVAQLQFNAPHLPLGISFFIFQAITYVVDISRNHAKVERNPLNVALYISMFPQLVAGPIVRFEEVSRAIHYRVTSLSHVTSGIERFVKGLAKKVLIADPLAVPVEAIFSSPAGSLPPETAWLGIVCFSLQIFFDFSAYSDMAIGLGRALGFRFPENFNYPYRSRSVKEFWRRWHMTLSRWFRDYVYFPLGGNRLTNRRTYVNLIAVFTMTALWHGASWSFLVWGLFHGLFLILERIGLIELLGKGPRFIQHGYLLLVIMISWVFFRASDLSYALHYIGSMFFIGLPDRGMHNVAQYLDTYTILVLAAGLILAVNPFKVLRYRLSRRVIQKLFSFSAQRAAMLLSGLQITIYSVLTVLSLAAVATQTHQAFIYFRF